MASVERQPPESQALLDGTPLATMVGEPDGELKRMDVGRTLVLSRFAWVRREGSKLLAETSLAPQAVMLEDPRAHALMYAFVAPRRLDAATAEVAQLPLDVALDVASLLLAASVLIDSAQGASENEPPFAFWEFHDLLFHARSRVGRQRGRSGGSYRFAERFAPAPAVPPPRWPNTLPLERPDLDNLELEDPPLAQVQSARASIREFGAQPLSITELGALLYRVGRIEDVSPPSPTSGSIAFAAKPYPSGGALYELELYAAVRDCAGIEPGLYHYMADQHRLARVTAANTKLDELITNGAMATGVAPNSMQVLIVLTARFRRLAWKYESIAYALVLKHVGVVLQTMYLVTTAMGLAPCAIGTGDSDLFSQASGIDYYEEPAVGEFALGSRSSPGLIRRKPH